ncbi:MAG: DUF4258 domain-containing protein [Euryarchaeota archaeon]|nr:DUF4258 domain-containing protein [Euryarchaeota archaeon]
MDIEKEIKQRLHNIRHTLHAVEEQFRDGLVADDVDDALRAGFEIIEDYPDDPRGRSCLVLCWKGKKPLHVVCAPHEDTLIIITTYVPKLEEWERGYKTRKLP